MRGAWLFGGQCNDCRSWQIVLLLMAWRLSPGASALQILTIIARCVETPQIGQSPTALDIFVR